MIKHKESISPDMLKEILNFMRLEVAFGLSKLCIACFRNSSLVAYLQAAANLGFSVAE